jgi:ribosomal protein S18 acetylase RimI-like enzyme
MILSAMIRVATLSDVDDIATLHVKAWQAAYRGQMPDAYLNALEASKRAAMWSNAIETPNTLVLVAREGEALLGFCSLLPSRDADASPAVGEISSIYVDPMVWRSGIGSALLEAIIEAAIARGFSDLTLWVLTSNTPARAFYRTHGFESDDQTKLEERAGFSIHETRYRRRIVRRRGPRGGPTHAWIG